MKINPLASAVQYFARVGRSDTANRVTEKGTADNAEQRSKQDAQQQQSGEERERKATPDDIAKAVDAFAGDEMATSNGLHAEMEGAGPGLRVVLKDVSGQVLRQYSGDEFVRLRENTAQDARARGKILDQKL